MLDLIYLKGARRRLTVGKLEHMSFLGGRLCREKLFVTCLKTFNPAYCEANTETSDF